MNAPALKTPQRLTTGRRVAVDQVEEELHRLWRQMSEQTGHHLVRACLWNLVVYHDLPEAARFTGLEETGADPVQQMLDRVTLQVPARVIRLEAQPRGGPPGVEMEAWVAAMERANPEGGRQICAEEVVLAGYGPDGARHFPPLIRAMMVPDMPVALVWLADLPREGKLLKELIIHSQKVIIDTRTSGAADHLIQVDETERFTHASIVDLSWMRLTPVRYLIAGLFDPPARIPLLKKIERITLTANPQGRNPGYLLLAWLLSRLGASRCQGMGYVGGDEKQGFRWKCQGGRQLEVVYQVEQAEGGLDGVVGLEIVAAGQLFALHQIDPLHVMLSAPQTQDKKVALHGWEDPELVVAALGGQGMDPLYPSVLELAAQLVKEELWNR